MKKNYRLTVNRTLLYKHLIAIFGLSIASQVVQAACTPSRTSIICDGSYTVYNQNFAGYDHVKIDLVGDYNISGPQGMGYYQNGGSTTINAALMEIYTNGKSSDGIRTNGSATININGQLLVKTQGSSGDAINVANSNKSASTVYINGEGAHLESKNGIAVRTNLTQNAAGNNAYIGKNATIITTSSGSNSTEGKGYAVYAGDRQYDPVLMPTAGTAKVVIDNGSTIKTSGSNAHAVYANKTGVVELGSTNITTTGTKAHGLAAEDGKITFCNNTNPLLCALSSGNYVTEDYNGGQIYLTGDTQITVDPGKNSYAMYASGQDSLITSKTISGANAPAVYTVTGNLVAERAGQINLQAVAGSQFNGNTSTKGANSLIALNLAGASQFTGQHLVQDSGVTNLTYRDNSQGNGNMLANTSGAINLTMAQNATINGDMTTDDTGMITARFNDNANYIGTVDDSAGGEISMDFTSGHAKWQMLNNSHLSNLHFGDSGEVILGDNTNPTDTNRVELTIENLSGNGQFYVRGDLNRDGLLTTNDGDKIYITTSSSGQHKVYVRDANLGNMAMATTGDETLRVVEDHSGGSATFTLGGDAGTGVEQTYVDVGAYQYTLNKEDTTARAITNYWTLSASKSLPPDTGGGGGGGSGGGAGTLPPLTNAAKGSVNIINSNYLMSYVETQTLLQRMGQLRQSDSKGGDAWARVYGGKLNSFSDARLSGFDMTYSGMQVGVDRRLNVDSGNVYLGVMAGVDKGDTDYTVGSGSTESYHAGIYGTYQNENGFYVDGLIKYSHMNNDFSTITGGGYPVNGSGNTNGFSVGVEIGKRFYVQSANQQGWYIEPQGQLTYSHQSGATVKASNGLTTDLHSYNSVLGRASIIVGYSLAKGKNPVDVYFKTGYVREFDGKTGYTFNHFDKEAYNFGGGWWDNGIGVNMRIGEKHNLYVEGNYAKGGKFDRKQINLGYRLSF